MKLCGFLIVYNEEKKGNIRRCLENLTKLCDVVCIYDDASTDNTVKICREYTPHVVVGKKNIGFPNKPQKNILMRYIQEKVKPDFVWWQDADEIVDRTGLNGGIRSLCEYIEKKGLDAMDFHEINLYLSQCWKRVDRLYDVGWFCRLWRNSGNLPFQEEKKLHPIPYPTTLKNIEKSHAIQVIHYGFSTLGRIKDKYLTYRAHGQSGNLLDRLKPVGEMVLVPVDMDLFPKENLPKAEREPAPMTNKKWKKVIGDV